MSKLDIDQARYESIASAGAGFAFLFCFGLTWIACAIASYFVSVEIAAWIYILQAVVAAPAALALQRALRYPKASPDNPLWPLAIQLFLVQAVAFPAYILALDIAPAYTPVVFAALLGAHFLPYQWLHRTRVYGVLAVVVSVGAYVVAIVAGTLSVHYTGFFVGAALLVASVFVRAHAKRVVAVGAP